MTQQRITSLSAEELEEFFLLVPRILCDYRDSRRGPYKIAYVFGNTSDNEESSFLRIIELASAGHTESVAICEGERDRGYEGFDHSVARLKELGFHAEVPIVKFDVTGNINTLSEARYLAAYARDVQGDIAIVAPPFHLVRTFMTTITALAGAPIRVYAMCGAPLRWNEQVRHSQGIVRDTRSKLLIGELQRLEKYRTPEFGGMLSAEKILEYLDWRDS